MCMSLWSVKWCNTILISFYSKITNTLTVISTNFGRVISCNLHNYNNLHVCPFLGRPLVAYHSVQSYFTNPVVWSQNVTNKSCLVCVKSEKYAFLVTPRLIIMSMRRGKAELHTFHYQLKKSQTMHINLHFSTSLPPQCCSQAVVCVGGYFLVTITAKNLCLLNSCTRGYHWLSCLLIFHVISKFKRHYQK